MPSKKIVLKDGESFEVDVSKKIVLKSSDGESFEVDVVVAREMVTIAHMIDDDCVDSAIPLPNVNSKILAKVIEYCKKHVETTASKSEAASTSEAVNGGSSDEELKAWDAEFMKIDKFTLIELMLGANYLNVQKLVDLTCQTVAEMMKGKTPEEIRRTFNIKNDFSPEEVAEVRKKYQWAFN